MHAAVSLSEARADGGTVWWNEGRPEEGGRQVVVKAEPGGEPVDVLPDPQIRQELSALSGWPTIPQVFIRGELVGGADIVEELYASGELQAKLDEALGSDREPVERTVPVA